MRKKTIRIIEERSQVILNDLFHCTMGLLSPAADSIEKTLMLNLVVLFTPFLILQKYQSHSMNYKQTDSANIEQKFFKTHNDTFITDRHANPKAQEEYDKRYGLVPYNLTL